MQWMHVGEGSFLSVHILKETVIFLIKWLMYLEVRYIATHSAKESLKMHAVPVYVKHLLMLKILAFKMPLYYEM